MGRRIGRSLAIVLVLVAVASSAVAQSAPPRIVQASDGTLYVIDNGSRYAIVGDAITDDELAQYPDGGPTGGALLLGSLTPVPASAPSANGTDATQGAPQFVSVQGNSPGRTASVTVQTSAGATCSLAYTTPSGTRSTAAGLGLQTASASGIVTWSFLVGSATRRGVGTVTVGCPGGSINSAITIG